MGKRYGELVQMDEWRWEIPKSGGMRVPGLIYASEKMISAIMQDNGHVQVKNVAHLPGIQLRSMAMPDIHWGYGFPIGGVAAMDAKEGVISPGGVGYDINCGCRVLATNLTREDLEGKEEELGYRLFSDIPAGVGSRGGIKLARREMKKVLKLGAQWAVQNGYGYPEDIEHTENKGRMADADPDAVSQRAYERGADQLGTLGSGNHFLEVGVIERIYRPEIAAAFGLHEGQVTVMIHSGSRGLGHQVCTDYLAEFGKAVIKYKIELPDRQLACAPFSSPEGQAYFAAMCAAANYAWANRQILMHLVRESFGRFFDASPKDLGMRLVYDVAHNIAKVETHEIDGEKKKVVVHRKGATRAFAPNHPELPADYRPCGQPVLIPGDMGRYSYILAGTEGAMRETFGSTCHGAGRVMSRHKALKYSRGKDITGALRERGIFVFAKGKRTLGEEISEAYKDVESVVEVVENAGLSVRVARIRPVIVVKG